MVVVVASILDFMCCIYQYVAELLQNHWDNRNVRLSQWSNREDSTPTPEDLSDILDKGLWSYM